MHSIGLNLMKGQIQAPFSRILAFINALIGLDPIFIDDFRRIPQGLEFLLCLTDEGPVFSRRKKDVPFLIVRQGIGRHIAAADDHGIVFGPGLSAVKEVAFGMEGPFFGHHPQFYIGKFQQLPQGIGLCKIQVLRGQYLPYGPVIFNEGILQAGNAALGQKGDRKQKLVADVELRQDGVEDLSFLFFIIRQDFRHIALVGFDGIVDKAFAQALFKGSVFRHDSAYFPANLSMIGTSAGAQSKVGRSFGANHLAATCSFRMKSGLSSRQ